jgi:hypothetical protein
VVIERVSPPQLHAVIVVGIRTAPGRHRRKIGLLAQPGPLSACYVVAPRT